VIESFDVPLQELCGSPSGGVIEFQNL